MPQLLTPNLDFLEHETPYPIFEQLSQDLGKQTLNLSLKSKPFFSEQPWALILITRTLGLHQQYP